MKNALTQFFNAQAAYRAYLEANGNDGSEQYVALLAARDAAAEAFDAALVQFIAAQP